MFVGDLPFKSVNHLPDAQGRFIQKQVGLEGGREGGTDGGRLDVVKAQGGREKERSRKTGESIHHLDSYSHSVQPCLLHQLLLSTNQIPSLTGFSRAVLKPGQTVERHTHASMHEVFWVESGKGR